MKKIRQDFEDTMRPEYKRSDFGDFERGRYATAEVEFSKLVEMFLACIGEDEGVSFLHRTTSNDLLLPLTGKWTYEIDNANQVTLRYWVDQSRSLEESFTCQCCISTADERSELQILLEKHVQTLISRVKSL
jgi:hypothetical protein